MQKIAIIYQGRTPLPKLAQAAVQADGGDRLTGLAKTFFDDKVVVGITRN